jgi:hypothetical protein
MLKLAREWGFAKAEQEMTRRLAEHGIAADLDEPSPSAPGPTPRAESDDAARPPTVK